MNQTTILFARSPVPGKVKTRLTPALSPQAAAELHEAFVRDSVRLIRLAAPETVLELWTDTPTDAWGDLDVARKLQISGDLGLKMLHAANSGFAGGADLVAILGSDSPTLPPEYLRALVATPADVALGPAEDGGYWGIVMRRTHPAMFLGVPWSTDQALAVTQRACRAAGLSVGLGPLGYDVDTPADLDRVMRDPRLGPATSQWFSRLVFPASPAAQSSGGSGPAPR